jgi:hypothetical protein
MTRLLARAACTLGFHRPPPGANLAWTLWVPCSRPWCEALIEGRLANVARRGR